jgi:hypothetical protein
MIRFEKKAPPRQASDPGPDPLSPFVNHGIRGIHGKGAPILVGLHSACSVCSPAVATCRRSHLSPDGGGLTRQAPPLGSGWLRFAAKVSRSPAVATCLRSHLSPDGGGLTRHAPPLGSGWLRIDSGWLRFGNQPGWGKAWIVHGW